MNKSCPSQSSFKKTIRYSKMSARIQSGWTDMLPSAVTKRQNIYTRHLWLVLKAGDHDSFHRVRRQTLPNTVIQKPKTCGHPATILTQCTHSQARISRKQVSDMQNLILNLLKWTYNVRWRHHESTTISKQYGIIHFGILDNQNRSRWPNKSPTPEHVNNTANATGTDDFKRWKKPDALRKYCQQRGLATRVLNEKRRYRVVAKLGPQLPCVATVWHS